MMYAPEPLEPGREQLRRAIAALPEHEPALSTWPTVAHYLAGEAALQQALPHLPDHTPDDDLWSRVAARLDGPTAAVENPLVSASRGRRLAWPWLSGVAAALLLLVGVWFLTSPSAKQQVTLTYAVEEVAAPAVPSQLLGAGQLELEGQAYIEAHCAAVPTACASPEFEALHAQLTEVSLQEQELREASRRFGNSPELEREQTRLTILKASLTRELVQHIIS